jgi:hypothetical protein
MFWKVFKKFLLDQDGRARGRGGRLSRLWPDQRGVALVETIFASTVLVLFIVVVAQLFIISDLCTYTLAAAHRQTMVDAHKYDSQKKFAPLVTGKVTKTIEAMPGMERMLKYFDQGDKTPKSYEVTRELSSFAGSFEGQGENKFFWESQYFPVSFTHGLGAGRRQLYFQIALVELEIKCGLGF